MAVKLQAIQMDLFGKTPIFVSVQKDEPVKIHPPVCQYCEWDEPNPNCIYCRNKVKKP